MLGQEVAVTGQVRCGFGGEECRGDVCPRGREDEFGVVGEVDLWVLLVSAFNPEGVVMTYL